MTDEEIVRLPDVCGAHRRLLYETALLSGLRANELRSLTLAHLDTERRGLNLDAEWTKNRKPGFQVLPGELVERLRRFADDRAAEHLYEKSYTRRDGTRKVPANPLLFVPFSLSRDFDKDLNAAGIPKWTPEGKLDFHAIRLAFINLVLDSDISAREAWLWPATLRQTLRLTYTGESAMIVWQRRWRPSPHAFVQRTSVYQACTGWLLVQNKKAQLASKQAVALPMKWWSRGGSNPTHQFSPTNRSHTKLCEVPTEQRVRQFPE